MISEELRKEIGNLSDTIMQDPRYKAFLSAKKELEKDPGLYSRTNDYRRDYMNLLREGAGDRDLHYRQTEFMNANTQVWTEDASRRFLLAEFEFAKLIRETEEELVRALEIGE